MSIKSDQSKYADEAGILRYRADNSEVFPGPTGCLPRWNVARTRPDDGAPSIRRGFRAGSPNLALIRFLDHYGQQPQGTRVDVRAFGTDDIAQSYVRGAHVWEPQS